MSESKVGEWLPCKEGWHFMVGEWSLNINNIVIVKSPVGSGLVNNFDTKREALNALAARLKVLLDEEE